MLGVAVGALIGYVTNWLAIRMLFWPHEPKFIWGKQLPFTPGLFVRRRRDFSESISALVEERFVSADELFDAVKRAEEQNLINKFLDEMGPLFKIGLNLYAQRVTPETFRRDCHKLVSKLRDGHVISSTLAAKLDTMSSREVETMIMSVVRRELRAITYCGAVLGALIGLVQCL